MAGKGDLFRSVEDMFKPDVRQDYFVMVNRETGEKRSRTLEDHHAEVANANLNPSVPEEILIQYETARNTHLYAWCAYRLHQVAERQAYATVELALRIRLGKNDPPKPQPQSKNRKKGKKQQNRPPTLGPLFKEAVAKGIIRREGFSHYHYLCKTDPARKPALDKEFMDTEIDCMCYFRNDLAHGSDTLFPRSNFVFQKCCDIINQLYPADSKDHNGMVGRP